jgi:hypothetical protein
MSITSILEFFPWKQKASFKHRSKFQNILRLLNPYTESVIGINTKITDTKIVKSIYKYSETDTRKKNQENSSILK